MVKVREDMTGWIMAEHGVPDSRLTIIKQVEDKIRPNGTHEAQWLCQCSCGSEPIKAVGARIKSGHVKSCGCFKIDIMSKENKVDLSGEYGILWTINTNEEVYFDLNVADDILQHTWFADGQGYPTTKINGKKVRMHSFLGCKGYDHKDRNPRNNRMDNLRYCTQQENMWNRSKRKDAKNTYIGVHKIKSNKWIANIGVNGRKIHLGTYLTETDALVTRLRAEKEYYGEFAPQRCLFEKYDIFKPKYNEWISVENQLPIEDGAYVCYCKNLSDNYIAIYNYSHNLEAVDRFDFNGKKYGGWYKLRDQFDYVEVYDVLYWMLLSQPHHNK